MGDALDLSHAGAATCVTRRDGALWCGEQRVGTGTDWVTAHQRGHTCAIKSDRSLWCWGPNTYGELGLGDTVMRADPTRVGSGSTRREEREAEANAR